MNKKNIHALKRKSLGSKTSLDPTDFNFMDRNSFYNNPSKYLLGCGMTFVSESGRCTVREPLFAVCTILHKHHWISQTQTWWASNSEQDTAAFLRFIRMYYQMYFPG